VPVEELFRAVRRHAQLRIDPGRIARRPTFPPARGGEIAVEIDAACVLAGRVGDSVRVRAQHDRAGRLRGLGPIEDAAREQHRLGLLAVQPRDQQVARLAWQVDA